MSIKLAIDKLGDMLRWSDRLGSDEMLEIESTIDILKKSIKSESKKESIEVPISESDIELFKDLVYNNEEFNWTFSSYNGTQINILFIREKEEE